MPAPAVVARFARGGPPPEPVWVNGVGGITFRLDPPTATDDAGFTRFVKWLPRGADGTLPSDVDLAAEADRLAWVADALPVPRVLELGADDEGQWLVTAAVLAADGSVASSAVAPVWLADPRPAVHAVGEGLRIFHELLDVDACPFRWDVEYRRQRVRARLAQGEQPQAWHPEHRDLTIPEALRRLADAPPLDRLVVCHGDACAPNTLVDRSGQWAGHVDLDTLGLADRWADLAVADWSLTWNYGPGWSGEFFAAYGISPDPDRLAYYRLLSDLG